MARKRASISTGAPTRFALLALVTLFSILPAGPWEALAGAPQTGQAVPAPNTLTPAEEAQGWRLLFDGRDLANWRGVSSETVPERIWSVREGMIVREDVPTGATLPDGQPVLGGDIITRETFLDFEFAFEWKVDEGANSGVKYNVDENLTSDGRPSRGTLGFEYQVIDDHTFPDPLTPKQRAGSLYDLAPARPANAARPAGLWNRSRILFQGTRIEHWLNGVKVVAVDTASPAFRKSLAGSKFAKIEGFARKREGHIALQDHNGAYAFRNLKVREPGRTADWISTAEVGKRIGLIGLDTSHAPAFAGTFNARNASADDFLGFRVVAAYPQGSRDIESSVARVPQYVRETRDMGIEIVDSIPALLGKADLVLLTSNDGRVHLEQALPVIAAGKPLYIDKPMAASLADVIALFDAARAKKVPLFSASSLRWIPGALELRSGAQGAVEGADAFSWASLEPTHPDLYWYGIHGVEILYTVMGTGCLSVSRFRTEDTELCVGQWEGGRIGTVRGLRSSEHSYGGTVFAEKKIEYLPMGSDYAPMLKAIARFFATGQPPVPEDETIEIYAFMSAADRSKAQGGRPVLIADVLAEARTEAAKRSR
jgi:3-keto-disaccharide hydrolase/Oxidoreductase family, NAD-binding Rossmann fold